jgi:2-C-methyl-D-erythritol 4-phosphate cytidylyltransferase
MKIGAVIVCAGRGRRIKQKRDKAFLEIDGIPLFFYSYKALSSISSISQIVIVARKKYFSFIKHQLKDKSVVLTTGGKRRQDSVYKGLVALDSSIDYVIVHDGARPFLSTRSIKELIRALKRYPAVTLGLSIQEALKLVKSNLVEKTVDRHNIYSIQTPQGFKKEFLLRAYKKFGNYDIYDETQIIEKLGAAIRIIKGDVFNIKITYPQDLALARIMAGQKR